MKKEKIEEIYGLALDLEVDIFKISCDIDSKPDRVQERLKKCIQNSKKLSKLIGNQL